jgi:hypothetical protein
MNETLLKALLALVPAGLLFCGSAILVRRVRRLPSLLQLVGAAGLIVVVVTLLCEALRLFPAMQWGAESGFGHHLDFVGATCALTLFPLGYLLHALSHGKE